MRRLSFLQKEAGTVAERDEMRYLGSEQPLTKRVRHGRIRHVDAGAVDGAVARHGRRPLVQAAGEGERAGEGDAAAGEVHVLPSLTACVHRHSCEA